MTGMAISLASHGIVDTIITLGKSKSAVSNHLSTSSSLAKHPHGCPYEISVITSMAKNETLRAKSNGRSSEDVEMYLLLIRARNSSKC